MGFDYTVHRIELEGKIRYVYELPQKEPGEKLYFRTMGWIFNSRTACISGRKTRVWRAIQVTGPDGLELQGNTEVALKDVWLDKDSQTEKQNQKSIYTELEKIKQEDLKWLDDDYQGRVKEALKNMPFMGILTDYQGTVCRERLPSARPDRTILSTSRSLVSSSRNVIPSSTQNPTSYAATDTCHDAPTTLKHRAERKYKARRQYRLVYEKVGYALHDVRSIDKAFKAIQDVLTGDKISLFAEYYHC